VVLSGGGAKSAAHLGAVRALASHGLTPSFIAATSMGAVFGAMLAAGLEPDRALERALQVSAGRLGRPERWRLLRGVWAPSVLGPEPLRRVLEELVPVRRFDELLLPFTVTAVDIDSGELVLFGATERMAPLLEVLYASCALPVFFPPGVIEGRRYGDGGLRAVLPLDAALRFEPDLVVAVDVGPGFDEPNAGPAQPALLQAHDSATRILMAGNTALTVALWREVSGRPPLIYVRPRVERGATFRVDLLKHYAQEGERATAAALAEWLAQSAD
jgi:NTE family protein